MYTPNPNKRSILDRAKPDFLTGLFLRESLAPILEKFVYDSAASKKNFSLALIDLDKFKKFNDKYGHSFGDEVLKYASSLLRLTFADVDCHLFRYGGDEFIVVFPEIDAHHAKTLIKKYTHNLSCRPFLYKNRFYKVRISCGIATFPNNARSGEELIQRADEAMYFSKREGRNKTTLASSVLYLKVRNFIAITLSLSIIAWIAFGAYRSSVGGFKVPSILRKLKNTLVSFEPRDMDKIVLHNDGVLQGRITSEHPDKVVMRLYPRRGQGLSEIPRSSIKRIEYGATAENPPK